MKLFLLLACLVLAAVSSASVVSKKVYDFASYFIGAFDNEYQTQQPGDNHPFIQVRNVPVDTECFRKNPVLSGEVAIKGVIRDFLLMVVNEGIDDTVSLAIYNYANQSNYKPGEFNVTNFSNMSCEDFHEVEDCTPSYRVADGYIFGNFPQCGHTVRGEHPRYTVMHTCNSVTLTTPQNAGQPSPTEPYELLNKAKYPLINPPKGYVAPCRPKI
ncbi:hypothetical protein BsWGS_23119 [Bradybaena similaris]